MNQMTSLETPLLTAARLLTHWQGHRDLTRRTIEAFSEEGFEQHHASGMRSFQEMTLEILGMMDHQLKWLRSGQPQWDGAQPGQQLPSRAEILRRWDEQTAELAQVWPTVSTELWLTPVDTGWGRMSAYKSVEYLIENEIHHRAQGYVYLRELGTEPPSFYERSDVTEE
ncbi:DinB family protein [Deinococcus sp. Marseille-Q6407]|uniref:DinB family protein n=1 Tax=Deinococcus sp. Marseille-Q6407 TaxID=2969223 RepID=UPI0021BF0A7C|nr:DinB family protein [Deinococcus sp. Marseille-Q6407]